MDIGERTRILDNLASINNAIVLFIPNGSTAFQRQFVLQHISVHFYSRRVLFIFAFTHAVLNYPSLVKTCYPLVDNTRTVFDKSWVLVGVAMVVVMVVVSDNVC